MDDLSVGPRLCAWAEDSGCRLLVLFGSRAGSGPVVKGDVDLAVDYLKLPDPRQRLVIVGELQEICGSDMADVVFLHRGTDPVLRFEVFRGGQPLFESPSGIFIREQVRALMLYEDARPFRLRLLGQVSLPREESDHVA